MKKYLSVELDNLNIHNTRNIRNTHKRSYNCGGYALGTYNWYRPYPRNEFWDETKEIDKTTKEFVNYMIKEFDGKLRQINTEYDIKQNEICIAFRMGSDDFHYARKSKSGQWRHKMGYKEDIRFMTKQELYSSQGWRDGRYNGPLVFLALKK